MDVQVYAVHSGERNKDRDSWLGKLGSNETWVVFSVSDNGPGIDPDIVTTVLEYPAGDRRKHVCLGMGLRIVRRIVAAYDGKFFIRRRREGGTEVLFALKPYKETPR